MREEIKPSKIKGYVEEQVSSEPQDQPCLDMINEAVAAEPGIVGVKLDPHQQQLAFDYDPGLIDESTISQIAQHLTPPLQHNLERCILRLGPHGGRSCESCALALEKKLSQVQGVRRTAASYRGGVLSVTYDNNLVSPDQLKEKTPVSPIDYTKDLSCPILGLFGNEDRHPAPEQVDQHEAELKKHGKNYEFHRYDGAGLGFFYDHAAGYRQAQAVDGWQKVFAFLGKYLA